MRQELALANCTVSDSVGDVVRVTADIISSRYQVTKLDITNTVMEVAFGVIISKQSDTECVIQLSGHIQGLYSGLTAGEPLFVGDDAQLTHDVPSRPMSGVKSVYHVALAVSADVLFLSFQQPSLMVA